MSSIDHNIVGMVTATIFLQRGRNKNRRPLHGRSTELIRLNDETIAVKYHNTNIVTYHNDGSITLNTDGWRTLTSKAKINEYTPAWISLYQSSGIWYVMVGQWGSENRKTYVFADGMTISGDSQTVTGAADKTAELEAKKLIKRINKYATDYVTAFLSGKIAAPNGGDCWHCLMRDVKTSKPLGESTGDTGHLISHMDESYFPGSLLKNAIDSGIFPTSKAMQWGLGEVWGNRENSGAAGYWTTVCKSQYVNLIRRYLKHQFALAAK